MELLRALAVLVEPPRPETARLAELLELERAPTAEQYAALFTFQLYPYASVYVGAEGMLGGEARDRVAGFWRALGEVPPAEPDHLAVMLALYARLSEENEVRSPCSQDSVPRRDAAGRARAAFLWEHLLSWLPVFLDALEVIAPAPYARWGRLLREVLVAEARLFPPPPVLPLHLRDAAALRDGRDDGDDRVAALLAPVRSGLIVTRATLRRAAEDLGCGLRAGERRFALRALLEQDKPGAIAWLAQEAAVQGDRHAAWEPVTGAVARFWAERAAMTEAWLGEGTRGEVHGGTRGEAYRTGDPSGTSRSG